MKTYTLKTAAFVAGVGLLSFLPLAAQAYTIGTSGTTTNGEPLYQVSNVLEKDYFKIDWSYDQGSNTPVLEALALVHVTNITRSRLEFEVYLKNTTSRFTDADGTALRAAVTVLGLEVEGYSSGNLSTPGMWLDSFSVGGIPGFSNQICASTEESCTSSQYSSGIRVGSSDTFAFKVHGDFNPDEGVTFKNFGTKWQSNYQDIVLNVSGKSSIEMSGVASEFEIPEPTMLPSLALVGAALLIGIGRKSDQKD